jgi:hypothetical protein
MLICQETDGKNYYNIIDTDDKDIDFNEIEDYVKHYTKNEIVDILKTETIIGLDKNKKDFIDTSSTAIKMYNVDNKYYALDLSGLESYIFIHNLYKIYIYNIKTDMWISDGIEIIDYLDVTDIEIEIIEDINATITNLIVVYEIPQIDAIGRVNYILEESGFEPVDSMIDIESYLGEELSVDFPVKTEYATEILDNLGINADLSDDFYAIYMGNLCMEFIDKDETMYLISKGMVYKCELGNDEPSLIYQNKEVD